jgi:clan AA aspartic protease
MTRGLVTSLWATVNVVLRLPDQPDIAIEFVIDTAFRGALALPPQAIAALGLPFFIDIETLPASGIPFRTDAHIASILWEGKEHVVPVIATGTRPLLGTALLANHRLNIAFEEGGIVEIDAIS